jgi:hypothetical protein
MKLLIKEGKRAGQGFALTRPKLTLGRGEENDIILAEHGVSRQHVRIHHTPQGWMLTDLGSTNGTFVNGQRIRAQEAYLLCPGDQVAMGAAILVVQDDEPSEPPTPHRMGPAPEQEPRRKPHPALLVGGAVLLVVVLVGIVALLVALLQPEEETITTPTDGDPVEKMITALPVPTELQDIVTSVVPMIPTGGLPIFPPRETPTPPPPGADLPRLPLQVAGENGGP